MSDRLDDAIDGAVREMLDVEPPADLRAKVIARIAARPASRFPLPAFSFQRFAVLTTAAVAILILAVALTPRSQTPARGQTPVLASTPQAHVAQLAAPAGKVPDAPAVPTLKAASTWRIAELPRGRGIAAAVADTLPADFGPAALEQPASLAIARIDTPQSGAVGAVNVEALQVPAIQVNALPDTPRERQLQE